MTLVLDTSILIDIEKKNQEVIAKMVRLSETYIDPPRSHSPHSLNSTSDTYGDILPRESRPSKNWTNMSC